MAREQKTGDSLFIRKSPKKRGLQLIKALWKFISVETLSNMNRPYQVLELQLPKWAKFPTTVSAQSGELQTYRQTVSQQFHLQWLYDTHLAFQFFPLTTQISFPREIHLETLSSSNFGIWWQNDRALCSRNRE